MKSLIVRVCKKRRGKCSVKVIQMVLSMGMKKKIEMKKKEV